MTTPDPAPEYGVSVGYDTQGRMRSIRYFGDAPPGARDWESPQSSDPLPDVAAKNEWPEEFRCPGCGIWLCVDDDYERSWCEVCGAQYTKVQIVEQARAQQEDDDG